MEIHMEVVLGKDGIKKEIGIKEKKEKGHTIKMAKDLEIKNMNTIVNTGVCSLSKLSAKKL